MTKPDKFEYTYVAPTEQEKREILSIKQNYEYRAPKSATKLDRLRKLDAKVTNLAMACSISLGVIGLLVFGTGMTMVLEWHLNIYGIIVGLIGVVPIALAYPTHKTLIKIGKKKYGAEILALSNELLEIKNDK